MPETKITEIQVTVSRIDWPRSGWTTSKNIINVKIKNEIKCVKFKLLKLFELIICAIVKMKNGFKNSTGWKLKKYKLNHLLAPFTSIPKNGTTHNIIKKIKKKGIKVLFKKSLFKKEMKIIKQNDSIA